MRSARTLPRARTCSARQRRGLFEAVQAKLSEQRTNHIATRSRSGALLQGRIFDDRGNRMTPTHVTKEGVRYRCYISAVVVQGQKGQSGSVHRVPAIEIETIVVKAIREQLGLPSGSDDRDLFAAYVESVRVHSDRIMIVMNQSDLENSATSADDPIEDPAAPVTLAIPWSKAATKRHREIIVPEGGSDRRVRPARAETRDKLLTSIAQGRRWLSQVISGSASIDAITEREGCSPRRVNMMLSLAFLGPDLVKAAVDRRLPRGIGVTRLFDPPAEWSRQHRMLGLTE